MKKGGTWQDDYMFASDWGLHTEKHKQQISQEKLLVKITFTTMEV